jgi:tRNA A-37 threonylcarbamoyl transferase component Bud32
MIKRKTLKYYFAEKKIRYWRQNKQLLLSLADSGYKTKVQQLGLDWDKITSSKNARQQTHRVELGEIDQDGFLLSKVGKIPNVPSVSKKQFLTRKRFGLQVVAIDGYVCVEKHYKGNKSSFVNEIEAHYHLGRAGCNIPVIIDVDFDNLTLTFSYISGRVLREELAGRGAVVRDRDIEENPGLTRSGKRKLALNRIPECRRVLSEVIDSQFIELIFAELNKIHKARFIWNDIKYGNVIIEEQSGKPYMIDFDWALRFQELGKNAFRILSDRDIEKFNACFGKEKLTYKRIKSEPKHRKTNKSCAPVDFGFGFNSIRNTKNEYGPLKQKCRPVNNSQD